jgi:2-polyprenyl-6-methoxyphenol hydroxylase-like FAD-dependent oxidoreductase
MSETRKVDVLVVGAGPTGLLLASELARRRVGVRLIEKRTSPAEHSRALAVLPRTMEMMDQLGLANAFTAPSHQAKGICFYGHDRREAFRSPMNELPSEFPFFLLLPQTETEMILVDHARKAGVEIERGVGFVSMVQNGQGVLATLERMDGATQEINASYVVGCDGSRSAVRQAAGLEFQGGGYDQSWLLADVVLDPTLDRNWLHGFTSINGPIFFFPLPNNIWRIVLLRKRGQIATTEVSMNEIVEILKKNHLGHLRARDPSWLVGFGIQHRRTLHIRAGRVFLCGDAAHVHSPAGGQGMNMGLGDAFNLGWKLAHEIHGNARKEILDSYEEERMPVIAGVMSMTDQMTRLMTATKGPRVWIREWILPIVAKMGFARKMAMRLSQLSMGYPHSSIVLPGRVAVGVKPGERVPPLSFFDLATKRASRTPDLFRKGKIVFLVMPNLGIGSKGMREVMDSRSDLIDWQWVVKEGAGRPTEARSGELIWVDGEGKVRQELGLEDHPSFALLRPDGIVMARGELCETQLMQDFLCRVFGGSIAGRFSS